MPYLMSQAVAAVYVLLRDPSQEELYFEDVKDRLNALLQGYVTDMDLSGLDHRTVTDAVDIAADDIDYTLTVPNIPDYKPVALEYSSRGAVSGTRLWYKANLIPFAAWAENYSTDRVVASIYGSAALTEGQKLKLNISPDNYDFRLSYRLPLLAQVQMGERPPIPAGNMPMLDYDGALECIDLVKRDTPEWIAWVQRVTPKYLRRSEQEHERWQMYLEQSVEDPIQPLARFDEFRHTGTSRMPRAYLPRA